MSIEQAGLILALLVAGTALSILSPYFLAVNNFLNIGSEVAYTGVAASIATLVLIAGGLDLSVGAVMTLAGCVVARLISAGLPWELAFAIGLLAAAAVGAANGAIIQLIGINPFIVTIGMQFLVIGAAYIVTSGATIAITSGALLNLGQGRFAGIPTSAWVMLACFLACAWLLRRTRFGIRVLAIGGTPHGTMARLAGINVKQTSIVVYVASAVLSGLAGIIEASYTGAGDPSANMTIILTILAAVILGGTSLVGGRGSVFGTLLGVLLLGTLQNGTDLLNLGTSAGYVTEGVALLAAVIIDEIRRRRRLA